MNQANTPVVIASFNRAFTPEEVIGKLKVVHFVTSDNPNVVHTLTANRYENNFIYFDAPGSASAEVQLKASGRDIIANFSPGVLRQGYLCDLDFNEQHKREAEINSAMYLLTNPKLSYPENLFPIIGIGVQQGVVISKLTYRTGADTEAWLNNIELNSPTANLFLSHSPVSVMVNVLREILAMEYTNELDVDSIDSEQAPPVDGSTFNFLTD